MYKFCKIFCLTAVISCWSISTHGAPILLDAGDQAIFTFDFSSTDISSAGSIQYQWTTSLFPASAEFPLFEMSYSIYDELNLAPYYEGPSFQFTSTFSHYIGNSAFSSGLFDDSTSYIVVDFLGSNGAESSAALMETSATVYVAAENSPAIAHTEGVASIPTPATLPLLAIAVAGFYLSRRVRIGHKP